MYCIGCGLENLEGSAHCIRCGQNLITLRTDQYTKPAVDSSSPILWNPDMAALLSIPFSPIFGAAIHALNWKRLGQPHRAKTAWYWTALIVLAFLSVGIYGGIAQLEERNIDACMRLTQLLTLIPWYFGAARGQGKYLMREMRGEYRKESWFVPVSLAIILTGLLWGSAELLR